MRTIEPYNPLDKKHIGESVAEALLRCTSIPLTKIQPFNGAGIYAIYYTGDFPAYAQICSQNIDGRYEAPIYVGKAVPPGARKGNFGVETNPGPALFKRLGEHAKSIEEARNLNTNDFQCRYLVVDDIWIPLGESLLIAKFSPVWNKLIDGFGNHTPGAGRFNQMRSRWDVLHPGRAWAEKCKERSENAEQISMELKSWGLR